MMMIIIIHFTFISQRFETTITPELYRLTSAVSTTVRKGETDPSCFTASQMLASHNPKREVGNKSTVIIITTR